MKIYAEYIDKKEKLEEELAKENGLEEELQAYKG